ncbi:MAG: GNAT family N-acetyltransferase [Candidatus Eremiobacteraeota bacterium]|nr:GNAT family N-acetyltransferase [Candidatus Eremiobacteraeota bacterium]
MPSEPLIVPANAGDVAYYAQRRQRSEHSRQLYAALAETAPNGAWVAKDEGTPIGIAIAHALEDEWQLSELFVEPGFRKQGIGAQLLAEVARDPGDVNRSGMLDPRELGGPAFFLRRGVAVQMPIMQLAGAIPREDDLMRMAAGDYRFSTEALDAVRDRHELSALDRSVRGTARPLDHAYFSEHAQSVGFWLDGEFAGYAYVWASGAVGPVVGASPGYLVQFFAYALVVLQRTYGASWCTALVPGTNLRIMRAALRTGLAIESVLLFGSDNGALDLSRYVGFHELLF